MQAKDVIRQSIEMADFTLGKYLEDLDDAALLHRPVGGINHIAWQLGHLLSSERNVLEGIKAGCCPPLPEGFEAKHSKETSTSNDPTGFHTKAEYMAVWKTQSDAIKALVDSMSEADLDAPAPEGIRSFCPTVGAALNMMGGIHPLMHVGQFVAVRRSLGKPIAF